MREWFEGKTVALVGNAASLFETEYGAEIDEHDVVARINKAAMFWEVNSDWILSHGTRTDVWFMWNPMEYRHRFHQVESSKRVFCGHELRNYNNTHDVDLVYPDSRYLPLKLSAGKHNNPTTGLIAIDWILSCEPKMLSLYGFDWKQTPTWTDPDRVADALCPHDHEMERKIVADLAAKTGKVQIR